MKRRNGGIAVSVSRTFHLHNRPVPAAPKRPQSGCAREMKEYDIFGNHGIYTKEYASEPSDSRPDAFEK